MSHACLSRPQAVRRALDLLAEKAGEPVTIVDLSRAACVSERTLRNAFHAMHQLSPKKYVIRARLEEARHALQLARGVRGAVTRVATDCGFYELGRFAGAYRHLFGESPSDTLRNGRQREFEGMP
jgi:transcriptional regulator GlxA family with amidase domain